MNEVEWKYGKPIPTGLIEAFEEEFDVELPNSFKQVVLRHDGSMPTPGGVEYSTAEASGVRHVLELGELFSFEPDGDGDSPVAEINRRYAEPYPGFIVFSEAGNGWHFAFEIGKDGAEPRVVLFTFEDLATSGCIEVARSFDDLVSGFRPAAEEEQFVPET